MGLFLILLLLPVASLQETKEVKVKAGEAAALECHSAKDATISLLEWSRPDLDPDGYIFFYRDERSYEKFQHPSVQGRVELRDPQMKGGDVSVVLRNVNINDTGRYDCYVSASSSGRRRRDTADVSKTIELVVEDSDSGPTAGHSWTRGLVAGPVAGLVIVIAIVAFGVSMKHKTHMKQKSSPGL
ncbi:myelin-oligodendrocyte glycoprotein-like [Trachinotus anak]|uniref:myelin-oligodendrocyte glycoprotein-like n=1 Tax=Trachinotus anak TaxID=443729 RepID=UPI0039F18BF1